MCVAQCVAKVTVVGLFSRERQSLELADFLLDVVQVGGQALLAVANGIKAVACTGFSTICFSGSSKRSARASTSADVSMTTSFGWGAPSDASSELSVLGRVLASTTTMSASSVSGASVGSTSRPSAAACRATDSASDGRGRKSCCRDPAR